jgi:phosphinothricin acetyltransferase
MIRMATPADIPQILDIYAPYVENTAISFEYTVPTHEAFTQRFAGITRQFAWLVWEQNGQILGYAYGSLPFERAAYQWCAEASIYLRPAAQGKGIGKALYAVLEELLILQGYKTVYAIITTANIDSRKFHEKVGYRFTAQMPDCGFKLGRWHGTVWMEKTLISMDSPENPPISVREIGDFDRKFADILSKIPIPF